MFYLKEFPNKEIQKKYSEKYKEYDINKFLPCIYLLRAGSDALKAFESYLSQYNFSQAKFLTLMILLRNPEHPLTPSEIAQIMGVKKPTTTGVIDGLLKEGLVTRETSETDRRKTKIKISPKAIEQLESILPEYFQYINDIMKVFSVEEAAQLKHLLSKFLGE